MVRLKHLVHGYEGKLAHVLLFPSLELCCNGRYRVELIDRIAPHLLRELSVKPENMEKVCTHCHKNGDKLLSCGKCGHATYCTRECQCFDWGRHKEECGSFSRDTARNPLMLPVRRGDLRLVQKLVQEGIDVNMPTNTNNTTALYTAASMGNFPWVRYLLRHGADKDKTDNNGFSSLYIAAQQGHLAVVKCLVDHGADKDRADINGCSPLYIAAQNSHLAVVQYLLEQGADKDKANNNGSSPLYAAAQNGHFAVVQYLLEHGADLRP